MLLNKYGIFCVGKVGVFKGWARYCGTTKVGFIKTTAAIREVVTPTLLGVGKRVERLINWLFFYLMSKLVCFDVGFSRTRVSEAK